VQGFAEEEIDHNKLINAFDCISADNIIVIDNFMDKFRKSLVIIVSVEELGCVGIVLEYDPNKLLLDERYFIRLAQRFKTLIKTFYLNREYIDLQSRYMNDIVFSLIEFMEIYDSYTNLNPSNPYQ
jgi:hypothetical protein